MAGPLSPLGAALGQIANSTGRYFGDRVARQERERQEQMQALQRQALEQSIRQGETTHQMAIADRERRQKLDAYQALRDQYGLETLGTEEGASAFRSAFGGEAPAPAPVHPTRRITPNAEGGAAATPAGPNPFFPTGYRRPTELMDRDLAREDLNAKRAEDAARRALIARGRAGEQLSPFDLASVGVSPRDLVTPEQDEARQIRLLREQAALRDQPRPLDKTSFATLISNAIRQSSAAAKQDFYERHRALRDQLDATSKQLASLERNPLASEEEKDRLRRQEAALFQQYSELGSGYDNLWSSGQGASRVRGEIQPYIDAASPEVRDVFAEMLERGIAQAMPKARIPRTEAPRSDLEKFQELIGGLPPIPR